GRRAGDVGTRRDGRGGQRRRRLAPRGRRTAHGQGDAGGGVPRRGARGVGLRHAPRRPRHTGRPARRAPRHARASRRGPVRSRLRRCPARRARRPRLPRARRRADRRRPRPRAPRRRRHRRRRGPGGFRGGAPLLAAAHRVRQADRPPPGDPAQARRYGDADHRAALFAAWALYVSLVEHPARMETGPAAARIAFRSSYRRAAPWQAAFASLTFASGLAAALVTSAWAWALGGVVVGAAVPFTLLVVMPTTRRLLASACGLVVLLLAAHLR